MSIVVAAKLNDVASVRVLEFCLRQVAGCAMVHLVVVIFHGRTQRSERREAQDLVRQQFGKLLRGRPHKLHIVRLLTGGESPTDLSAFIARAITSKAAALESDVVVVGGRARQSAAGIQRSSAVAEGVRRHSRRPVLFIADEHPLLCRTLSAIAEETDEADEVSDEEQELCSQATLERLPSLPMTDALLANHLLATIGQPSDAAHLAAPRAQAKSAANSGATSLSVVAGC